MNDVPVLKPCPFCGKDDVFFKPAEYRGVYCSTPAYIGCKRCGFEKTGFYVLINNNGELSEKTSNQMLIDWWNRRGGKK